MTEIWITIGTFFTGVMVLFGLLMVTVSRIPRLFQDNKSPPNSN
jgi:RsiW-degrading membrane proteinase PrsW (M82 family)